VPASPTGAGNKGKIQMLKVMRKNNITSMPVAEGNMPSAGVIIPAPTITAGLQP